MVGEFWRGGVLAAISLIIALPPPAWATAKGGQLSAKLEIETGCAIAPLPDINLGTFTQLPKGGLNKSFQFVFSCSDGLSYELTFGRGLNSGNDNQPRLKSNTGATIPYILAGTLIRGGESKFQIIDGEYKGSGIGTGQPESLNLNVSLFPKTATPDPGEYRDTVQITFDF